MNRRVLSCDQIRRVDQIAINEWGIPGIVLMENAGRGVADVMCEQGMDGPVVIACAKGNNGGDGFVIARHLHLRGHEVTVVMACEPSELSGDAAWNYEFLRRTSVPIRPLGDQINDAAWLVDALLGTGAKGAPRSPITEFIRAMNRANGKRLAVDVPSGLDARSGEPSPETFCADLTCTFVAEKEGFANPAAAPFLGQVHTLDIGLPWELVQQAAIT